MMNWITGRPPREDPTENMIVLTYGKWMHFVYWQYYKEDGASTFRLVDKNIDWLELENATHYAIVDLPVVTTPTEPKGKE